jgi:hypothetical protein
MCCHEPSRLAPVRHPLQSVQIATEQLIGTDVVSFQEVPHLFRRRALVEVHMSDEVEWNFADPEDAKAEIRAAVHYLLNGKVGSDRGAVVREIVEIVRNAANSTEPPNPLDEGFPGG